MSDPAQICVQHACIEICCQCLTSGRSTHCEGVTLVYCQVNLRWSWINWNVSVMSENVRLTLFFSSCFSPSSLLSLHLFLLTADLPAPLSSSSGSAAAQTELPWKQILSPQWQVSLTSPLHPPPLEYRRSKSKQGHKPASIWHKTTLYSKFAPNRNTFTFCSYMNLNCF